MKTRTASLSLLTILCLVLAVVPAMADTLYSNGPVNGTTDAWTINFGFSVSDSFTCSADCTVQDFRIGVWLFAGDSLTSVDMALGSTSFRGSFNTYNAASHTDLGINQFGYDVQIVDFATGDIPLSAGTSWITLQNAVVPNGDPVYWDENSGSSQAFENQLGSIPSEAFTVTGTCFCCGVPSPDCGPPTPEPSSIMLFGSGILGLVGVLRRKLNC
jgi:PEP-CTERM motif